MVTLQEINKTHTKLCKYVEKRYSLMTITKELDALKEGRATRKSPTRARRSKA
jgi:hypothetical protein